MTDKISVDRFFEEIDNAPGRNSATALVLPSRFSFFEIVEATGGYLSRASGE